MKILGHMLATRRNRTGASAVAARDDNFHATHQYIRNYCYFFIPVRAEDAVKLSSKVSHKDGRENQTKRRLVWIWRHNEKWHGMWEV